MDLGHTYEASIRNMKSVAEENSDEQISLMSKLWEVRCIEICLAFGSICKN